jgi:hypothetical protein
MFPIIPLLALAGILGGGGTLLWYDAQSKEKQQEADRLAADYANQLFGKTVDELSKDEAGLVASLTEQHLAN